MVSADSIGRARRGALPAYRRDLSPGIDTDTIITVGFLNERVRGGGWLAGRLLHVLGASCETHIMQRVVADAQIGELWRKYIATFDVVIVNDGDCSFVNDLVHDIVRGGQ